MSDLPLTDGTSVARSRELFVGKRFSRWLDRRIPPTDRITLSQKNVFIFPTATGFAFGGVIALLILGAIHYQASLVYGVPFLLGSLFLVTIPYTFRNLSGPKAARGKAFSSAGPKAFCAGPSSSIRHRIPFGSTSGHLEEGISILGACWWKPTSRSGCCEPGPGWTWT